MLPLLLTISMAQGPLVPVPNPTPIAAVPKVEEATGEAKPKPVEFTARIGELKRLRGVDGAKWELQAGTVGADLVADGKGGCVFSAETKGRYVLICYTDGPAAWVIVTVGDAAPVPPVPPGPGPAPIPPGPIPVPPPVPPNPQPLSPEAQKLKAAIDKDGGLNEANKAAIELLAGLIVAGIDELNKPEARFTDDLFAAMKRAGDSLAKDRIPTARVWLTEELKKSIGTERRFITDDLRKSIGADLAKLHGVIKEVTGK